MCSFSLQIAIINILFFPNSCHLDIIIWCKRVDITDNQCIDKRFILFRNPVKLHRWNCDELVILKLLPCIPLRYRRKLFKVGEANLIHINTLEYLAISEKLKNLISCQFHFLADICHIDLPYFHQIWNMAILTHQTSMKRSLKEAYSYILIIQHYAWSSNNI